MNIKRYSERAGDSIRKLAPLALGYKAAWPIFSWLETSRDDWQLSYLGEGEFEYIGGDSGNERKLGRLEAVLSIAPAMYGIVLLVAIHVFIDGLLGFGLILAGSAYLFLTMRVMNEVSVHDLGGEKA